ncbi:MAG: HAMP domain-containing protein, partial [Deltaproteobacteria bacterium]
IAITFLTGIFFMVLVGFLVTKRNNMIMYRDIERQGRLLAETLAIPVMNDLIYERLGLVEEGGLIDNYITEIFNEDVVDLVYITVLDTNGRVVSHNDFSEYGLVYDDPITANALTADNTVVQKFYAADIDANALDFATPLSIGKKRWGTLKFGVSLKMLEKEMQATIYVVVVTTILMLASGLIVIIMLSRRFIRPITELARTMEQAGGDQLDVKVVTKSGTDEIALLGKSFNRMIDRIRLSNLEIKNTHDKLLQFVSTIEKAGDDVLDVKVDMEGSKEINLLCRSFNQMIDRIRQSNLELQSTHEKLLQAEKLASLGILASGVAHEINNPLGGLFNCVDMLEERGEDKNFRQRYLDLLKDGLGSIENTVGKLLWMSSTGEKIPQDIEFKQALSDAFGLVEYKLKKSSISYKENIEAELAVWFDPYDLQQVLINLMINAVQSMPEGGILTINAFCKRSKVILEVSDTGEGIDKEDISKIFDPFYTTKQPGEGTGLGLWLTYEIVHSYGGVISVTSRKNEGTTFSIILNCTCETT